MQFFLRMGIVLLLPTFVHAQSFSAKDFNYRLEPLFGYESVYRTTPTPHTTSRGFYGARFVIGKEILSLEAEFTKGSDTETYSTAPETIKYNDEKYKLGVRSTYNFNQIFFTTLRAGGQGDKSSSETISGGVSTKTETPMKYYPYAGASLGIRLGSILSISAGSTVVFKDNKDFSKNEIQSSISLSIGR